MRKISKNTILLVCAGIFFALGYFVDDKNKLFSFVAKEKQFVDVLHSKEAVAENILFELNEIGKGGSFSHTSQFKYKQYAREDIYFYVYAQDSLIFWTGNGIPLDKIKQDFKARTKVLHLKNGWYLRKALVDGSTNYLALIRIKQEFPFQNDYLVNKFPKSYDLPQGVEIERQKSGKKSNPIYSKSGQFLFYLDFDEVKTGEILSAWAIVFYLLCILLLSMVIVKWYERLEVKLGRQRCAIVLIPLIISARIFSFAYPQDFNAYNLFDPTYYASSKIFPSFGDMLINVVLILVLVSLLIRLLPQDPKKNKNHVLTIILGFILFCILFFYGSFITDLFNGIIDNSSINFHLSNLFRLDGFIYFGLLSISLLYLSFFILGNRIIGYLKSRGLSRKTVLIFLSVIIIIYVIINDLYGWVDMIMVLWSVVVSLLIFYHQYFRNGNYPYASIVVSLFFFAFLSSHILSKYSKIKEEKSRVFLAEKFVTDQDPITETSFPDIKKKLQEFEFNDKLLTLDSLDTTGFKKQLISTLFTGYWRKYIIDLEVFNSKDEIKDSVKKRRLEELDSLAGNELTHGFSELTYVSYSDFGITYLFRLNIYDNISSNPLQHLFFIFKIKEVPEEIGFPVLLLDTRNNSLKDLRGYSYARFVNNKLSKSFGSYEYPLADLRLREFAKKNQFFNEGSHNHLYYEGDENNAIVLSKQKEKALDSITLFSYLFSFHSIVLLGFLLIKNINYGFKFSLLDLKVKVQILIAAMLFVTLVLFAFGTRYFIENEYKEKNFSLISEKIESVLVEVTNKIKNKTELDINDRPYLESILEKFSGVFFTDISLYNKNGDLLATSRNQVFEGGLLSRKIHPEAFVQLSSDKRSKFINEEQIGKMKYLSAYVPFINSDGKLLAYLNLPYFARQDELENEIFTFLVSIVNIFVLLFGFSMVSAIFITNWITKPLKLLQDNLSKMEFGKSNQKIVYHGNDEIANLVNEYNRKVIELQRSSQLLAKSERESAWREMAKQVAHEIKNPLTPMKLSVQHLRRAKENKDVNWGDKFDGVSQMLIEQIDTLSQIASEFSDFAKMPIAERRKIDFLGVLRSIINLYKEESDINIELITKLDGEQFVYADKNQIGRVFGNLLKNACQAIPDDNTGKIDVMLLKEKSEFIIEVKDNGTGIPAHEQKKIFSPNFTTKTNGMGLGLAMVKNIVEGSGGKVWFRTEAGIGTSFFIVLPEYNVKKV